MVGCSRGVDTEPIEPNMTRFYALILLLLLIPVGVIAWATLTLYAGIHLLRLIIWPKRPDTWPDTSNQSDGNLQSDVYTTDNRDISEYPKYINERGEVV